MVKEPREQEISVPSHVRAYSKGKSATKVARADERVHPTLVESPIVKNSGGQDTVSSTGEFPLPTKEDAMRFFRFQIVALLFTVAALAQSDRGTITGTQGVVTL